jgi:hypothetical protein
MTQKGVEKQASGKAQSKRVFGQRRKQQKILCSPARLDDQPAGS